MGGDEARAAPATERCWAKTTLVDKLPRAGQSLFDEIARELARGGSRRDFVRRTGGLAAAGLLIHAGVPRPLVAQVTAFVGLRGTCTGDEDCQPCESCIYQATGELACVSLCADCETCNPTTNQCKSNCPPCRVCNKYAGSRGECLPDPGLEASCKDCDERTGEIKGRCTSCEKCNRGRCESNCPGACEVCEDGKCRKCDRPCESCNAGKCYGCDPGCERCNPRSGECETTCEGGFTCCEAKCSSCCGDCDRGICVEGGSSCAEDAKRPVCCGRTCHDLDSDPRNCGGCGNFCREFELTLTGERCDRGRCVCKGLSEWVPGLGLTWRGGGMECREKNHQCCDGNCVDMASYQTDPKHCGKCIVECEKDEKCVKGECVESKRGGYSVRYTERIISEEFGVIHDLTFTAVVRELARPDAESNTHAGWGTYEGRTSNYKANCANNLPLDFETISLGGKARGTATATRLPGGNTALSFVITPLDPPKLHLFTRSFRGMEGALGLKPEDVPDAVTAVAGRLELSGGTARGNRSWEIPGEGCRKTIEKVSAWEATNIDPPPTPKGARPRP